MAMGCFFSPFSLSHFNSERMKNSKKKKKRINIAMDALVVAVVVMTVKLGAEIPFESNHFSHLMHDVLLIKKITAPNAINGMKGKRRMKKRTTFGKSANKTLCTDQKWNTFQYVHSLSQSLFFVHYHFLFLFILVQISICS